MSKTLNNRQPPRKPCTMSANSSRRCMFLIILGMDRLRFWRRAVAGHVGSCRWRSSCSMHGSSTPDVFRPHAENPVQCADDFSEIVCLLVLSNTRHRHAPSSLSASF